MELVYDKPQYVTSRSGQEDNWSYGVDYKETVRATSAAFSGSAKSLAGVRCSAQATPGTRRRGKVWLLGARRKLRTLDELICRELEEASG